MRMGEGALTTGGVHMPRPGTDLAALKAAVRQLLQRLEVEEKSIKQWQALTGHRGLDRVAGELGRVSASLEGIQRMVNSVLEEVARAQEEEAEEHAKMHKKGIPHEH